MSPIPLQANGLTKRYADDDATGADTETETETETDTETGASAGVGVGSGSGAGTRSTPALDGLDLAVYEGSVYGLVGPSGAGKTTAVELLAGLIAPTAGSARVAGVDVPGRRGDRLARRVGHVPSTPSVPAEQSGREWLTTVADRRGVDGREARARVDRLAARLGVADALSEPLGTTAPATRRAVALVAAACHRPRVLLVDEAAADLDPATVRAANGLLGDLAAGGTTVLVASSTLGRVAPVADRVGVLGDGRLVAEGSPAAIRAMAAADGTDPIARDDDRPVTDAGDAVAAVVDPRLDGDGDGDGDGTGNRDRDRDGDRDRDAEPDTRSDREPIDATPGRG